MKNETIELDFKKWGLLLNGKNLFKGLMIPQIRLIYLKRKCDSDSNCKGLIKRVYKLMYKHYQIKYNVEIPSNTVIGKGFKLAHIGGIVINSNSVIGENVTILNGVLIGYEPRGKRKGNPTIGNKVWIGANATIVGKINIGNNVLIAPNSFINFDVPDNSIVVGNPAKVIQKLNATEGYISDI